MHRFFIPKDWIAADTVTFTGEPLHSDRLCPAPEAIRPHHCPG